MMAGLGEDAAYARLVAAAYEDGGRKVRAIALDLRPEIADALAGAACYDIEHAAVKWPYQIVYEVLHGLRQR